ncbi:31-kDa RNA binding protein [Rhynchospora pubera]|uniref:31-kDa RNA binding protein n=1 Tax=Rhynchospora pubera TaxID=906938 RepID=A0AAV8FTF4_9POAL|nr:31-kDa RNA binding protein [Rhynchospora pubera]
MATAAATSSSLFSKTIPQAKPSQVRILASSVSLPSKPFSLEKQLSVLASSCSVWPLFRRVRPFELGFVTRVVFSDLEVEQEEGEDGEALDYGSEDSYVDDSEEEQGEEEVAQREEDPNLKIFVGNLPFSVDSSQLAGIFGEAGDVEMVEVIYDKITGRSRGFGFVTMSTAKEVASAVEQFNGYMLDGRELRVRSGPPPPRDESTPSRGFRGGARSDGARFDEGYRVYVGNLSWGVDNSALESLFSEQGKVLDAKVIYDRETGRSRGFGFVTYGTAQEVQDAVSSLDGADLDGRTIRVSMAEARPSYSGRRF